MTYFHGGMSPQEIIVPVLTVRPKGRTVTPLANTITWHLSLGGQKISTRFCSVAISGTSLFEITPPKVRVEIRAGKDVLSNPVAAKYGFEDATGDAQLQVGAEPTNITENTITLFITEPKANASVTIHLLDAVTGAELAEIPAHMAISL